MTRHAKNFVRKGLDMARGRQIIQGDEVEEFWALKDVSFEVNEGEVVGIIGRNGAGKSTLLKILSRITEPTEGRVTLRGRVASLLEVGTGFHPELTGRENIFLNGAILGMARQEIKRKFDEIVDFAGVEKFLDTPVKRYSSGMYVRLAFSVASSLDPEILVIDEVLAVGDAEFQNKCLGKMHDVAHQGRTVLFVSHNMAAVERLCERSILLRSGEIAKDATTDLTIRAYSRDAIDRHLASKKEWAFNSEKLKLQVKNVSSHRLRDDLLVSFDAQGSSAAKVIGLGIEILTATGAVVSKLSPRKTVTEINLTAAEIGVDFVIQNLFTHLTGGTYTISVWFSETGVAVLYSIDDFVTVTVPAPDTYLTGHSLTCAEDGPLVTRFAFSTRSPRHADVTEGLRQRG